MRKLLAPLLPGLATRRPSFLEPTYQRVVLVRQGQHRIGEPLEVAGSATVHRCRRIDSQFRHADRLVRQLRDSLHEFVDFVIEGLLGMDRVYETHRKRRCC